MKELFIKVRIGVVSDLYLSSESILSSSKTINIPDTQQNIVCKLLHCETFASRPALIGEMEEFISIIFGFFLISTIYSNCLHDPLFIYTPKHCHHNKEFYDENLNRYKKLDCKHCVEPGKELHSAGSIPYDKYYCVNAEKVKQSDSDFGDTLAYLLAGKLPPSKGGGGGATGPGKDGKGCPSCDPRYHIKELKQLVDELKESKKKKSSDDDCFGDDYDADRDEEEDKEASRKRRRKKLLQEQSKREREKKLLEKCEAEHLRKLNYIRKKKQYHNEMLKKHRRDLDADGDGDEDEDDGDDSGERRSKSSAKRSKKDAGLDTKNMPASVDESTIFKNLAKICNEYNMEKFMKRAKQKHKNKEETESISKKKKKRSLDEEEGDTSRKKKKRSFDKEDSDDDVVSKKKKRRSSDEDDEADKISRKKKSQVAEQDAEDDDSTQSVSKKGKKKLLKKRMKEGDKKYPIKQTKSKTKNDESEELEKDKFADVIDINGLFAEDSDKDEEKKDESKKDESKKDEDKTEDVKKEEEKTNGDKKDGEKADDKKDETKRDEGKTDDSSDKKESSGKKKKKKDAAKTGSEEEKNKSSYSEFKSFGKDGTLLPGKKTSPPYASASERAQTNLCEKCGRLLDRVTEYVDKCIECPKQMDITRQRARRKRESIDDSPIDISSLFENASPDHPEDLTMAHSKTSRSHPNEDTIHNSDSLSLNDNSPNPLATPKSPTENMNLFFTPHQSIYPKNIRKFNKVDFTKLRERIYQLNWESLHSLNDFFENSELAVLLNVGNRGPKCFKSLVNMIAKIDEHASKIKSSIQNHSDMTVHKYLTYILNNSNKLGFEFSCDVRPFIGKYAKYLDISLASAITEIKALFQLLMKCTNPNSNPFDTCDVPSTLDDFFGKYPSIGPLLSAIYSESFKKLASQYSLSKENVLDHAKGTLHDFICYIVSCNNSTLPENVNTEFSNMILKTLGWIALMMKVEKSKPLESQFDIS